MPSNRKKSYAAKAKAKAAARAKKRQVEKTKESEKSEEEEASSDTDSTSRHPASATTTTTIITTTSTTATTNTSNTSEDSNTRLNTRSSNVVPNINNNAKLNVNSSSSGGGITTRRSRRISQAPQQQQQQLVQKSGGIGSGTTSSTPVVVDVANHIIDLGELSLTLQNESNSKTNKEDEDKEDGGFLNKLSGGGSSSGSATSEEEVDSSNLVVIKSGVGEEGGVSPDVNEGGGGSSTTSGAGGGGGSSEEEDTLGEAESYAITVNPDGSLSLCDESRELEPGQEKFKVILPKNKVKSPNNPLPGAVPLQFQGRIRKSKPEGSTYGTGTGVETGVETGVIAEKGDVILEGPGTTMSVGINPAISSVIASSSIDIDEFTNQLDPQSLAALENLIQSQQAREIIENLDLEHHNVGQIPLNVHVPDGGQKWDSHNSSMGSVSESASITSPGSSTGNSPAAFHGGKGSGGIAAGGGRSRASTSTSSRISESDPGNIRRSQRQQDRIEKQEAERIMAENQQMLKREKEIMQGGSLTPKAPIPIIAKKIESPKSSPIVAPSSTSTPKPALVGRASSSAISSRDSIDSSSGSERKPYPKRENRRLPAHLADSNYMSLEDEQTKVLELSGGDESGKPDESDKDSSFMIVDDEYDPDAHELSADEGDEEYTEDDPNKLWCICHQPHNNRFMICCDTCEDWFHGKCVGVSKAQGKAMELKSVLWICPLCKKAEAEKKRNAKAAARASHTARRSVTSTGNESRRMSKGAAALQADAAAAAVASKGAFMPSSAKKVVLTKRTESRNNKSEAHESEQICVVCNKNCARFDSVYCSDQCVQKHADTIGNKTTPISSEKSKISHVDPLTTSAISSPNKLKRANSKPDVKPSEPMVFNFHVISSGAAKSTEVVPPKAKEMTASQILKAQKEAQSPTKVASSTSCQSQVSVQGVSPKSVTAIISSTPTVLVKKMSSSDGKSSAKGKISPDEEDEKASSSKPRKRNSSQSDNRNKSQSSSNRKSDGIKEREREKDTAISEKLQRENMRKGLREILKARMKELTDEDRKKFNEGPYNPEALAEKIEDELYKTYGGANNVTKRRNKYRCIYFNLKAEKNLMYKELLLGTLKPKVLVRMETHEMATADLAEWRKKEAEKEIEAIKKSELDKIAESKKIQLLEKGVDDAVTVAEELRPLDISDVIDQSTSAKDKEINQEKDQHVKEKTKHHSSEKSKNNSSHGYSSSSRRDRDKDSSKSHHNREKNRDKRDKDRRRSDRHKDSSLSHRDKDRRSSSQRIKDKDKVNHSDNKIKENDEHDKDNQVSSGSGSGTDDQQNKSPEMVEPKTSPVEVSPPSTSTVASSDEVTSTPKPSEIDSEPEQPSSTIKTPDFAEDGAKKESKHLFQTKIVMPELGSFHASAHGVSHASVDGIFFPKSPVPVVGRISPDTVWDYINKMKKSKEVIVFRLSPASPTDSEGYMTFFSYFSSRSRLGVMGGIDSPLKDVYLVPLPKQSPIPRCLLPFRGPGLPEERTHCLLCIVTRNVRDPTATLAMKRKISAVDQSITAKKRVKLDSELDKPVVLSSSVGLRSKTLQQQKAVKFDVKVDDDDAPYIPWEEDSASSNSNSVDSQPPVLTPEILTSAPKPVDVEKQLEELEAKIAREKQDIEKITGALAGRSSMSGIPGLDGEFAEGDQEIEAEAETSCSLPEIVAITPPPAPTAVVPGLELPQISDPRLRRSQRYGANAGAQNSVALVGLPLPPTVSDVNILKTAPKDRSPEVMDIGSSGSSDDSSSKDGTEVKVDENKKESEEEAYSPSAMQFSDEDTTDSQQKVTDIVFPSNAAENPTPAPVVVPIEEEPQPSLSPKKPASAPEEIVIDDDDEPLPPGVDIVEPSAPVPVLKPVVHAGDINITLSKQLLLSVQQSPQSLTTQNQQSAMDVEDDFQPMRNLTKQPESKTESIFEKAETVVTSPFKGLSLGASSAGSKMKININLTTKQLPSAIETPKTEDSPAPATVTSISTKPPPKSLSSSTVATHVPVQVQQSLVNIHDPRTQPQQQQGNPVAPLPATIIQMPQIPPIPLHIPPPNLIQTGSVPPIPNSSVVINFNVPPPSLFMSRMSRPPVAPPSFPPMAYSPRIPFSSAPPPMPPAPRIAPAGGFVPSFGSSGSTSTRQQGNFPGPSPNTPFGMNKAGRDNDTHEEGERVQRVNLDSRSVGRDWGYKGRDARVGRGNRERPDREVGNFGRRRVVRSPVERIRRRRSGSRSGSELRRDRSRSPRDRRQRKRMSRSRSKSPLSRRYNPEARNRSRSRSRSAGRRGRNKSRTPSPGNRKRSRSRSPD